MRGKIFERNLRMTHVKEIKYHNQLWYYKTYNQLIDKCIQMESEGYPEDMYTEVHHILPKCMGGTNDESNLVRMPVRYHIMAHLLLAQVYPEINGLVYAAHVLVSVNNSVVSTNTAALIREDFKKSRIGSHHSEETRRKISESNKGKVIPRELVEKLRSINLGKKHSLETRKKMSEARKRENLSEEILRKRSLASSGRKHSEEVKKKISIANTGKIFSEEHRQNISKSKMGKGHPHTEKTKKMMSDTSVKRKRVQGPDGIIYESMKLCCEKFNIHRDTLRSWIKNHPEKGFKFID